MTGEAKTQDETSGSESLAANGSEALWETTTTLKEDSLNGEKLLREGHFENRGPVILSPAEYDNYKKMGLIKEP